MPDKVDFKKELKHLYNPSKKEPVILDVPPLNYLMIDGAGSPGSQEYMDAVSTIYPVAYALKFAIKKRQEIDYGVLPLEGLWWMEDMNEFSVDRKDEWLWTSLIMQPAYVTAELVEEMIVEVREKKNPPALDKLRFENYAEGTCVQLMHIGPYSEEGPNITRMHAYAEEQGYSLHNKHHEIYIKDVRRTAPEKLKTVLRQPITK